MIDRIDHIVLTVRDVEASVAFYGRVLGMEAVTFAGGRRALAFGQQKINLQTLGQEVRDFAGIGSGDLCLVTEWPVEDVLAKLAEENVEVVEGPVAKSGALGPITSVYFNDPDGNLIEVSRYD
ncbi:VOC family protein [Oceanicola sp. 502str15]|uniref:VOC family protein n=1 Tax=Oceanicola sp. 502str15 TaxID=2696061 RepID=UPI0020956662|nr:VOC family protein [Oceanicola sp. 502str15]MCO6383067.1 VOC family protein [Oceanicola sp. 502str15]